MFRQEFLLLFPQMFLGVKIYRDCKVDSCFVTPHEKFPEKVKKSRIFINFWPFFPAGKEEIPELFRKLGNFSFSQKFDFYYNIRVGYCGLMGWDIKIFLILHHIRRSLL